MMKELKNRDWSISNKNLLIIKTYNKSFKTSSKINCANMNKGKRNPNIIKFASSKLTIKLLNSTNPKFKKSNNFKVSQDFPLNPTTSKNCRSLKKKNPNKLTHCPIEKCKNNKKLRKF